VKPGTVALATLYAIIPLYGTLVALDPTRPPIPAVVPHRVAVLIGVVALAALAGTVPAMRRAARRDALTAAFFAPGAATVLAAITGFDPATGIGLGVLVTGVGGAGLAAARDADAATLRVCLRALLWSALLACALALAMQLTHRPAAVYAYDNGRAVGTFLNPNELAAYALALLGVALPVAIVRREPLAVVTAVLLVAALAATFSRWGLLCAVVGVGAFAWLARARAVLAAAVAVAVAGIALNAVAGARHHNPRDTEARAVAWQTGITTFERFPLLGVGPLAYGRTYDELRPPAAPGDRTAVAFDPHSLPLAFAAEGGIVAVVTLVGSYLVIFGLFLRTARRAAVLPRMLALGIAAGFVALTVDCAINTIVLFFALGFQVVSLGLGIVRTDAPA